MSFRKVFGTQQGRWEMGSLYKHLCCWSLKRVMLGMYAATVLCSFIDSCSLFKKCTLGWKHNYDYDNYVHLASSHIDMKSVIRTRNISPCSFFHSEICHPLGGGDAVGAGLHWPHARGDPGQHTAATEGILHVPEPGRGLWGHWSAG